MAVRIKIFYKNKGTFKERWNLLTLIKTEKQEEKVL